MLDLGRGRRGDHETRSGAGSPRRRQGLRARNRVLARRRSPGLRGFVQMADQPTIEPAGESPAEAPKGPTDLSGRSWWEALKRAFKSFRDDNATDWAAGLTYYGVLSVFPGDHRPVLAARGLRELSADRRCVARHRRRPRPGIRRRHADRPDRGRDQQQRHRGSAARLRHRRRDLGGLRISRRLLPGLERDLRGRGGQAVLEAPSRSRSRSRSSCWSARRWSRSGWWSAVPSHSRSGRDRPRRHGGRRLEHRQVAGDDRARRGDARDPLLLGAQHLETSASAGSRRGACSRS